MLYILINEIYIHKSRISKSGRKVDYHEKNIRCGHHRCGVSWAAPLHANFRATKLSIAVLEKIWMSATRPAAATTAVVHGGFANPIGSLKAKCCVEGNKIMVQLPEELNFPVQSVAARLLVGEHPEDMEQLERTMEQGAVNGCDGLELIDEKSCTSWSPPSSASSRCGPRTAASWTRS